MLFNSSRNKCIFNILKILYINNSTYSELFKKTGVSHFTLQVALKEMIRKEVLCKQNNQKPKKEYYITKKGIGTLELFKELEKI
jgi:predicted transcriptional regulator